jgi:aryl-alcohol dehydrogenase-like predicted oxidoreductase
MNVSPQLTRAAFLRGIAGFASAVALAGAAFAQPSEDTMQTRPIPASGKALPVIGVGTWQTFDVGASAAERSPLAEVLRVLFEAGGSVIDSSPMYGKAQGVVGELLTASRDRDKAFIATKVWTTGRQAGIDQMRHSMGSLGTDHIELMQVHNLVDWRTQLATLRAWKEEKRITYLGMTHYTASGYDQLEAVMRSEPLDFVQLDYAIDDRGVEQRLLPLAADLGIAILVNQPFGGGGLIRKLSAKPLPDWAGEIGCRSWAQILLKFVLGHPAVTCVIPGTSKPEHMRDNVQAGRPPMPDAAMCARMAASF